MNNLVLIGSLTAALSLSFLAAPTQAQASCQDRKTTGTIVGAAGGALLGNAMWHGGGGAVIGGVGGAVAGHEIAKGGCSSYSTAKPSHRHVYARQSAHRAQPAAYDEHGNPVYVR
jgi:uncharacterized protein YcfJ